MRYQELLEAIEVAKYTDTLAGAIMDSLAECALTSLHDPIRDTEAWIANDMLDAASAFFNKLRMWKRPVQLSFSSNVRPHDARFNALSYEINVGVYYKDTLARLLFDRYPMLSASQQRLTMNVIKAVLYGDEEILHTVAELSSSLVHEYVHGVQATGQGKFVPQRSYIERDLEKFHNALKAMAKGELDDNSMRLYLSSPEEIGAHAEDMTASLMALSHTEPKDIRVKVLHSVLSDPRAFADMILTTKYGFGNDGKPLYNRADPRENLVMQRFIKKLYQSLMSAYMHLKGSNKKPALKDRLTSYKQSKQS